MPVADVLCSLTPVESAFRPMLPSAFLTAWASPTSLRGSIAQPAKLAVYASPDASPHPMQDSLPAVPSAFAGQGWLPAGHLLEVSAHRILLNRVRLAHQEDGRSGRFEDCSSVVSGACIEVHRVLGPGLLESAL